MDHQPVESSNIASIAYDNGVLEVQFHSGARYRYAGVPPEVHQGLMESESKGRFLSQAVKGVYEATRVEET